MECKIEFSDVLSTDDIDFLIGSCMQPTASENCHVVMKNEKNVEFNCHMDYSITELATNVYQRERDINVGLKSEDAMHFVDSKVDFQRNSGFRNGGQDSADVMLLSKEKAQFRRNSGDLYINDICQNDTPSMQTHLEYKSLPIKQELPSQSKQPMRKKPRRFRTAFTARQMLTLEREYQSSQYLGKVRRAELAISIGLSEQTIKTWYQNRRMKTKREGKEQKSPKHRQTSDSNCPSIKPYGDSLWSIYPNNCAMQMQQQYQQYHHGMADVKQTVHRW